MSGVAIDPSCIEKYNEVKSCKSKCCIFQLSDDGKTIVPDEASIGGRFESIEGTHMSQDQGHLTQVSTRHVLGPIAT